MMETNRQKVFLISLLLLSAMCLGFEVCLTRKQKQGSVIFDSGFAACRGCQYTMQTMSRGSDGMSCEELFNLGSNDGRLRLSEDFSRLRNFDGINEYSSKIYCSLKSHNRITGYNQTRVSLLVFLAEKHCQSQQSDLLPNFLKSKLPAESVKSSEVDFIISIKPDKFTFGLCYPAGRIMLFLADYMPQSLLTNCVRNYKMEDSRPVFTIVNLTNEDVVMSELCVFEFVYVVDARISLTCSSQLVSSGDYTLQLIFNPDTETASDVGKASSVINDVVPASDEQTIKHRSRDRRAITNRPPLLAQRQFFLTVPEEAEAGLVITTITATDPDSGDAGRLTYSLLATKDGRSQTMFTVDNVTGALKTTQRLDREVMSEHYFRFIAKDAGKPPMSAEALLTIYVKDINDHKPVFESSHYSKAVSEGIGIGSTVLTLRASDDDSELNGEIEYSIVNLIDVEDAFEIDHYLGSITTKTMLDRERKDFYRLEILATDSAEEEPRQSATAIVEIVILDENDNRPQFSDSSYVVEVREDVDFTMLPVIAKIQATDLDAGSNGVVRYSITGGNFLNTFVIDSSSGDLSVAAALDFEKVQSYRLNVRAQDGGSPPKSNSTTVLIKVLNVNDNDPKFDMPIYQESVLENVPVGRKILQLRAYDADLGEESRLEYAIKDEMEDMPIAVNNATGAIYTIGELDREKQSHYRFRVTARDHGIPPRTATSVVEVTVRDVNDNAPEFSPKVYYETVSEEAMPGMPVVTVTAQDADENEYGRITYAIKSGNDRGSFTIISQMGYGLISVAQMLSHKQQSRYVLLITASDSQFEDVATVYINISDANLHRPFFIKTPYMFRIAEDALVGSIVYNVSAADQDSGENARIMYTMQDNAEFRIDPHSGDVILQQSLDREQVAGYMLTVTATDHGHPSKSDTTDIEVMVLDVNDNAPKFLKPFYVGQVDEDEVVGRSVLVVSAMDEDSGLNGRIRYSFEGGDSGNGDFMIDPTLGIIRTAKELDRERLARYELKLFAIDRGQPEQSTSVVVTIVVGDVNDNAPQFLNSNIRFYIDENSSIGSTVGSVMATDSDEGSNAEVEYTIAGGPDHESFSLTMEHDKSSAILATLTELDFEGEKQEYVIYVRARSIHLFSDAIVKILVQDVNDNIPQLKDFVVIFNNYKDHFLSGHVGRIPAYDPDVNDKLFFRFVSGNQASLLHLDEETGIIRLDSRLNSDMPTNGTLRVAVTDGINEVRANCRLYVRLVTEEMLMNSITVRLRNVRQTAFLSPIYDLFLSSLASIIPTTEESVFIINIMDDTDVTETILNVTFSVRQRVEYGRDVFYSQQFLQEKVYLQRVLLARLSTLEVLPFDDNLCIREPCLNFEECNSMLRFGNTSVTVGSDTMLFRPILPTNTFACKCPTGFTGMDSEYLCDTEVNLCYSSPCGVNGTCIQREGGYYCSCEPGFTGSQCETEIHHTNYLVCPRNVCRPPSRCVPKIRGGFRCELCTPLNGSCLGCESMDGYNEFCELRLRSFSRGSYLMFMPLRHRHRFNITMTIATRELNSLIFYNGRYNGKHDFVALEIINGQVQFSFSLGSDITRIKTFVEGGVSDGLWRQIMVHYLNRTATVVVGETCDSELSIQHGSKIGNYRCAGRATRELEERCRDVTETCHRFLDLSGPFHLGGLPSSSMTRYVESYHFVGCIKDLHIDSKLLDLNSFAWHNGTLEGCPQKSAFCKPNPCQNAGSCNDAWDSYVCDCTAEWTGKDCSQRAVDGPWKLSGKGGLVYSKDKHGLSKVQLPWCNGLSFRTRQVNATLMIIDLGARLQDKLDNITERILIEIINGHLHYIHPQKTLIIDSKPVNDGSWHYMETRWLLDKVVLTLDYGQVQISEEVGEFVKDRLVGTIVVGGRLTDNDKVLNVDNKVINGLDGCVKAVRVGSNLGFLLANPEHFNVQLGCNVTNPCSQKDICPRNISICLNQLGKAECSCRSGRIGSNCNRICDRFSPCHGGQCIDETLRSDSGYICKCGQNHTGRYCERSIEQSCPLSWWSSPICGPCNCPKEKGFDPNCNKTTGHCNCRANHYRVGDACYPCDCYEMGSYGRSCNLRSGQCQCRHNVIGRQCDACSSRFAEVTLRGCEVIYNACPRVFRAKIWWERTAFGSVAVQGCPQNMQGVATRVCNETDGWQEPNLEDCTSSMFVELRDQLNAIEEMKLEMNTFVAKGLVTRLSVATRDTVALYEMDISVTLKLLIRILRYETTLSGLNLTHTQDRNFVQFIANSVGQLTDIKYHPMWLNMNIREGGWAVKLLKAIIDYMETLARNMPIVFTQPFDAVHDNIVMGLDFIESNNQTDVSIPKYNNKVQNVGMFDTETKATINLNGLRRRRHATDEVQSGERQSAYVSYTMFKTLGDLLPNVFDSFIRVHGETRIVVNSAVFTIVMIDGNDIKQSQLEKPIVIEFRQLMSENRSNPQCAHWTFSNDWSDGYWTTDGCEMKEMKENQKNHHYVTCECNRLAPYALLMNVGKHADNEKYEVYMSTYIGLSIGLFCFALSFLIFCLVAAAETNANGIHIHLVGCLFISNLVFLFGIDKVEPLIACKVVAIVLQFTFMCAFMWLFVEILHIYRRMTDIRDVNHGPMSLYYVIGYVVPGIIVTLAVALNADGYGSNKQFCWLKMDSLLWSLAGPICCVVAFSMIIFIAAMCAGCQGRSKHADADLSYLKYGLMADLIYLPLQSLAWLFAILTVNNSRVVAFHYLFLIFTGLQGIFILLAFILLSKETKRQLHYSWYKMKGRKDVEDTQCITRSSHYSRSGYSFHSAGSSYDGGLDYATGHHAKPCSPKQSTKKDGRHSRSAATTTPESRRQPTAQTSKELMSDVRQTVGISAIPPVVGSNESYRKRQDSDSDSEISAIAPGEVDLASSHSSDDDDDDVYRRHLSPRQHRIAVQVQTHPSSSSSESSA